MPQYSQSAGKNMEKLSSKEEEDIKTMKLGDI